MIARRQHLRCLDEQGEPIIKPHAHYTALAQVKVLCGRFYVLMWMNEAINRNLPLCQRCAKEARRLQAISRAKGVSAPSCPVGSGGESEKPYRRKSD